MKFKALDLFCGMGGWSEGFVSEGFDITGVEIEPEIAKLYKFKIIVADVTKLNPNGFKDFDVIVGSPPCRDFSSFSKAVWNKPNYNERKWKNPPNPDKGLINVESFLNFIKIANPKYWIMENVPELEKHLPLKPRMSKVNLSPNMQRSFWGNFPPFIVPMDYNKKLYRQLEVESKFKEFVSVTGQRRLFANIEYAKIPFPASSEFAKVIKGELLGNPKINSLERWI